MSRCVDKSLGIVQSDYSITNFNVNRTSSLNEVKSCNSAIPVTAVNSTQLIHLRTNPLNYVSIGNQLTFVTLASLVNGDVINLVEQNQNMVSVGGSRKSEITFLESGLYEISLFFETASTESTLAADNILFTLSNSTPLVTDINVLYMFSPLEGCYSANIKYLQLANANQKFILYATNAANENISLQITSIIIDIRKIS